MNLDPRDTVVTLHEGRSFSLDEFALRTRGPLSTLRPAKRRAFSPPRARHRIEPVGPIAEQIPKPTHGRRKQHPHGQRHTRKLPLLPGTA